MSCASPATGELITELLQSQVQCVLATTASTQPCLHLMAYAFDQGLREIYFASYENTVKINNIAQNAQVAVLWDNRTAQHRDHVEGLALTATGHARRLTGTQHEEISRLLSLRNPTLSGLLSDRRSATFAVAVKHYRLVRGYGEIHDYIPQAQNDCTTR